MAQETKNAIRRAFIRLLNERPIDKISIKDIAETGAVNRNTFYYYYADIYALVEDIFEMEAADFLTKMRRYESWQEAFLDATDFAMQNKRAVFHLYNSANQGTLRRYYHKVILGAMMTYVQGQAEGLTVQDGMKYDAEAYIDHLGRLLDGNIRLALERESSRSENAG